MLLKPVKALPSRSYFDPTDYAPEMANVLSAEWICIGHVSDWESAGCFRRLSTAGRQIIIVRQQDSSLRGFYNTCRHRSSALCETESGWFLASRIICPYHAWAYDLSGSLLKTSNLPDEFELEKESLSLYPVTVESWNGFVFVNLADNPARSLMSGEIQDQFKTAFGA